MCCATYVAMDSVELHICICLSKCIVNYLPACIEYYEVFYSAELTKKKHMLQILGDE